MARMPRDRTDSKRSPGGRSIRRTAWLGIFAAGVVCVLFLQVVRLSVAEHATHLRNVERFLTDTRWLPASRGSIRDRNGEILASDTTSWDVLLQYDTIDGGWPRIRGRRAALAAVGRDAWREMSPDARDAEIDRHEAAFAALLDEEVFAPLMQAAGWTRDEFEARLSAIATRVERQAVNYRQIRKDALRRKYGGDAPIEVIERERAPSQLDAHVILENVPPEVAFRFQQLALEYPGTVSVEPTMKRVRPYDLVELSVARAGFPSPVRSSRAIDLTLEGVADHIVGYMRGVYAEDVAERPFRAADGSEDLKGYREGRDQIGSRGVERTAEEILRGTRGRVVRDLLARTEERIEPITGEDVELSIDIRLQARLHALLMPEVGLARVSQYQVGWERDGAPKVGPLPVGTELKGAIVVLDVETGGILSAVSSPTLADGRAMSRDDRARELPSMFRAFEGVYPPGSILKPLILCAAAAEGVLAPGEEIDCQGHYFPDREDMLRCHSFRPALGKTLVHGPTSGALAVAKSCNIFFYTLGDRLGVDRLAPWLSRFGLGDRLGAGLAYERHETVRSGDSAAVGIRTVVVGESGGTIPDPASSATRRDRVSEALLGIGQGPLTWTPLHAAQSYATLARRGVWIAPTIYKALEGSQERIDLGIPAWAIDECIEGLHLGVTAGFGSGHHITLADGAREALFEIPGVRVWGKTGTATAPPLRIDLDGDGTDERVQTDHAWFVGFAAGEGGRPRYVIAVLVEYGGSGGKVAGPIAAESIRALVAEGYFDGRADRRDRR
ncbi:MAG: Stage sporulation protein [Planctomycetota bacterium]